MPRSALLSDIGDIPFECCGSIEAYAVDRNESESTWTVAFYILHLTKW